jgi:hypothetical protein
MECLDGAGRRRRIYSYLRELRVCTLNDGTGFSSKKLLSET